MTGSKVDGGIFFVATQREKKDEKEGNKDIPLK